MNEQKQSKIDLIKKRIREGVDNDSLIERFPPHPRGYFNKMRNKVKKEDEVVADIEEFNGTFSTMNTTFIR